MEASVWAIQEGASVQALISAEHRVNMTMMGARFEIVSKTVATRTYGATGSRSRSARSQSARSAAAS